MSIKDNYQNLAPLVIFAVLLILSYLTVKPFLLVIFIAALLAYIIYPVFKWLKKKTKKPNLSSLIVCALVLLILLIPSGYVLKIVAEESYGLYIYVTGGELDQALADCTSNICAQAKAFTENPQVQYHIQNTIAQTTSYIVQKASNILFAIPTLILNIFILLFLLFYFLRDGPNLIQRAGYYLSFKKKKFSSIMSRLQEVTHGLVYGYIVVAIIQGALGTIGFLILGVPSAFFWGIVMTILALIPYLGTGIIWGPVAVIFILQGVWQDSNWLIFKGVALIAYGFVIVSGIDNILRPKIISKKTKVHPALILIGIFGGVIFFGPFGLIIGPVVLSMTAIVIETYLHHQPTKTEVKKMFKSN